MALPELPVSVPREQRQVKGDRDREPVYQTHRGKQATSRDLNSQPPAMDRPDGFGRWEDE